MDLGTLLVIGVGGFLLLGKKTHGTTPASQESQTSLDHNTYSPSLYRANMSDTELLLLWSNSPGIENVFGKRYYDANGELYRYEGNAYYMDLGGAWHMATPQGAITTISTPPWMAVAPPPADSVTTQSPPPAATTPDLGITFETAVKPFALSDIVIPDLPAGSMVQLTDNLQSMIDRGYSQVDVQATANIANPSQSVDTYRAAQAVLLAVVPDSVEPYKYLHVGSMIPAGTDYVVTNPMGSVDWIGQEQYWFRPEYLYSNPPGWQENIKRLGINI